MDAIRNYAVTIAYDGTNYSGWQIQANADSVQQRIKDALQKILRHEVTLTGAGRTDTGVHALGQTANFKTEKELDAFQFLYSLNSMLPYDIAVRDLREVPLSFDARHSAVRRSYIYVISRLKDPFRYKYSHYLYNPPSASELNALTDVLIRNNDFASFTKNAEKQQHTLCNLYSASWRSHRDFLVFTITGNRFLHGMVRTIVGTLLRTAEEGGNENDIQNILDKRDRTAAGEAVPAKGLFLRKVHYGK
ncbi:MAG: tRNA pseudouridine(38-40) synthase TruA [Ignavibacteriales bacterium]|nr:MAG: tRNA pseudouridine(38-40) synthase TruA [Ignavibacteriales bacterium]